MAGADKRILGIDPGTNHMGYGVIDYKQGLYTLVDLGVIHMDKIKDPFEKLNRIYEAACDLVKSAQPQEAAIEEPFYGKNIQAMLKLGRAQGVAIAAIQSFSITVCQYPPRRIKQSITGNGAASKEQVAGMLKHLLNIKELPSSLDATDGLAVALCHAYQLNGPALGKGKSGSWESFLKQNPQRVG